MAINSVLQTIRNAEIDARSLSEFVFNPADAMVSRRLAPSIHTLNYYLRFFDGAASSATADAKEIKEQLLSAQQQALGTVSYIENTIRDAIDTTVIENSPVSDALVSVDSSLSQRTINKGLESIADLSTINNPKDGLRVYVKSYHVGLNKGGGYFVYKESKASENDGGLVINGWVRQDTNKECDLANFGVRGDGSDDYAYISNAIAALEGTGIAAVLTHGDYTVSDFININDSITIDANGATLRASSSFVGGRLVGINASNVEISNLQLEGSNIPEGSGIEDDTGWGIKIGDNAEATLENIRLKNITVSNTSFSSIMASNCSNVTLDNCTALRGSYTNTPSSPGAIFLHNCKDSEIRGCISSKMGRKAFSVSSCLNVQTRTSYLSQR